MQLLFDYFFVIKNPQKIDKFSIVVSSDEIKEEDYSLSAMQYFDQKIDFSLKKLIFLEFVSKSCRNRF